MNIVLGFISAYIIFLLREWHLYSRSQKEIAYRLSSYLLHWTMKIIEEEGWFKVSQIGFKWQEEIRGSIKQKKGTKDFIAIENKYEENLNKLFSSFAEQSEELTEEIKKALLKLEAGKESKNEIINILRSTKDSILSGKTFISDQDASKLGHSYSFYCVSLKMHLVSLIDSGVVFLQMFDSTNLEYEEYKPIFESILKESILASKDIEFLSEAVKNYTH